MAAACGRRYRRWRRPWKRSGSSPAKARKAWKTAKAELDPTAAQIAKDKAECQELGQRVREGRAAYDAAVKKRELISNIKKQLQTAKGLEERQAEVEDKLKNLKPPVAEEGEDTTDVVVLRERRDEIVSAISAHRKFLQEFQDSGETHCPTCGTPVEDFEEHIEEVRTQLPDFETTLVAIDHDIEAAEQYRNRLVTYERNKATFEQSIAQYEEQLGPMRALTVPDRTEEVELGTAINDYLALEEEYHDKQTDLSGQQQTLSVAEKEGSRSGDEEGAVNRHTPGGQVSARRETPASGVNRRHGRGL